MKKFIIYSVVFLSVFSLFSCDRKITVKEMKVPENATLLTEFSSEEILIGKEGEDAFSITYIGENSELCGIKAKVTNDTVEYFINSETVYKNDGHLIEKEIYSAINELEKADVNKIKKEKDGGKILFLPEKNIRFYFVSDSESNVLEKIEETNSDFDFEIIFH